MVCEKEVIRFLFIMPPSSAHQSQEHPNNTDDWDENESAYTYSHIIYKLRPTKWRLSLSLDISSTHFLYLLHTLKLSFFHIYTLSTSLCVNKNCPQTSSTVSLSHTSTYWFFFIYLSDTHTITAFLCPYSFFSLYTHLHKLTITCITYMYGGLRKSHYLNWIMLLFCQRILAFRKFWTFILMPQKDKSTSILPSSVPLIRYRVPWHMESIPGDLGNKAGKTMHMMPAYCAHTDTVNSIEMPVMLQHMCLDCGRKSNYEEETPGAQGEHGNSTHRHQTHNPRGARKCVNH